MFSPLGDNVIGLQLVSPAATRPSVEVIDMSWAVPFAEEHAILINNRKDADKVCMSIIAVTNILM